VYLWAEREASTWGLFAFALDARIKRFAAGDLLLTFRSKKGFVQPGAIFPHGILLGADVPDVIASALERRVLIVRPELPHGPAASRAEAAKALAPAAAAARIAGLRGPKVFVGDYESTDTMIARFLLE
jgi:hypothetical protein